ncbi:MAG: hypothetical protein IJ217_02065 [Clostridia bacterium]|nr:hypothetical protein [Clostridia bacterium]
MANTNNNSPQRPMGRGRGRVAFESAKDTKGTLKRLLKYIEKDKKKLVVVFLLVIVSSLTSILSTSILKPIVDDYIAPKDWPGLIRMIGLMILLAVIGALATLVQNRIMLKISQTTVRDLRRDVFNQLVKLPIRYYDTHSSGELMSRITNDLQNVTDILSSSIVSIFSNVLTFVGVTVAMLMISPTLTLLNIIAIPIIILITSKIAKINRKQFMAQQAELRKNQWIYRRKNFRPICCQSF